MANTKTKTTLIIVLAVLGGLLAVLLALAAACFFVRRRRRAVGPAQEPVDPPEEVKEPEMAPSRRLRIRVQRPADADSALRQHHADAAIAELPWAPRMDT